MTLLLAIFPPGWECAVGIVFGICAVIVMQDSLDRVLERRNAMVTVPDPIAEAFGDAISAKADADSKAAVKQQTAAALESAKSADDQATSALADSSQTLAAKRAALEAVVETYFRPAVPPVQTPAPTPVEAPAAVS